MLHLDDPEFAFDPDDLRRAFSSKTKAIIINTPHNPTGKVFSRPELELIADLCRHHDVVAVTDEVYEHLLYDGRQHLSVAALPGMAERTVTINSVSKPTASRAGGSAGRSAGMRRSRRPSASARFPHRRRGSAVAGGRGHRAPLSSEVLH